MTELAVADALPEGFTTADLAEVDFAGDARAARSTCPSPTAASRRTCSRRPPAAPSAAWAEAVDGDDAALEAVASPEAVGELLYGGDATAQDAARGPRPARQARSRSTAVHVEPCPRR